MCACNVFGALQIIDLLACVLNDQNVGTLECKFMNYYYDLDWANGDKWCIASKDAC